MYDEQLISGKLHDKSHAVISLHLWLFLWHYEVNILAGQYCTATVLLVVSAIFFFSNFELYICIDVQLLQSLSSMLGKFWISIFPLSDKTDADFEGKLNFIFIIIII